VVAEALPAILVPAGPMPGALPNRETHRIRQTRAGGDRGPTEHAEAPVTLVTRGSGEIAPAGARA
jgi:hypothetical protein